MPQNILDSALKTRTAFAILKKSGNMSSKNDLLVSSDNGPDIVPLASLRIFLGMLLGPEDLLPAAFELNNIHILLRILIVR